MSYRDWHVGMKVVCIKVGAWVGLRPGEKTPQYGEVYTIRSIEPAAGCEGLAIRLVEIVNPLQFDGEADFHVSRFRPVQKRKTDIEIFKRLLTDPHVKIREDA